MSRGEYAINVFETSFKQGQNEGEKVGFERGVITTLIFLKNHFEEIDSKWSNKAAKECLEIFDNYLEKYNEQIYIK